MSVHVPERPGRSDQIIERATHPDPGDRWAPFLLGSTEGDRLEIYMPDPNHIFATVTADELVSTPEFAGEKPPTEYRLLLDSDGIAFLLTLWYHVENGRAVGDAVDLRLIDDGRFWLPITTPIAGFARNIYD